jgi:DHA1 family bicyclomycin/chloramphenicol resistance-like MFS transporter
LLSIHDLISYFIGISAGQLLYGPLLDRFGKTIIVGLLVYILGCAFVSDIDTFIGLRFIQASSCAATVAAIAMVRDLFPVKKFRKYSLC